MRYFSGWMRTPPFAIWAASICALLAATVARAQAPQAPPQGPPIVRSIEVEYTGPGTVSKERILAQIRTRVGQPYSNEVVEQDIAALYKTGSIQNVRIFAQPQGDGLRVIVAVQTRSILREIVIDGASRVKAQRLRKEIKLKLNQPVNEQQLEEARQKIIEVYQGRGRTPIYFLDKSGRFDEVQLQQDLDKIREFYQDHGYIDVEIKDVRRERTEKGPMILTIAVVEGPQYHVRKLAITGYQNTTDERVRALLKMKEGSVYSPKQLRDDAKAVADAYGSGGYVDLVVQPEGKPACPALIDVHYSIEEGVRSFVNRVNIEGNTRTKDKVIRREVLVAPGDVFNTVRVDITKKRLENLGYFAKVETYPEETDIPGRKDLTILVQEKRTGSLSFGGGYSTVDALVGFAELTQGNFDLFNWPSFTGGGQKFRLRIQYGTERKDFVLSITEPYFLDRRLSLNGQVFYTEANYLSAEYNQRNYGLATELRKPINAYTSATLGYQLQEIDIFDVAASASEFIQSQKGSFTESKVFGGVVFDSRDNPLLSRRGRRVSFSPYIAGGFLGGDTQIYGLDLEASQYFHLPWDTILVINGEVATVSQWGNGNDVPIFERLYLGGSNNLRGFPFREVGPQDENGEPLGGKSMWRTTIEWTFPIIEKARGAVFYDTGFVNSDQWSFGFNHIASDVGIGLRLDLPIGPLRLDYGYPVMRDGYNGGGRFNFNVGYQF